MDDMSRGRTAPPPKKRPNLFVRFVTFLITLALVMGAVVLVVNYDKLNFDFVKRWFTYRNLARSESGQSESFRFDSDISSTFAVLDGDLLVCSDTNIRLYSGSAQLYVNQTVSMDSPAVRVAGNTALIYDVGGQDLYVYRDRAELFSLALEDDQQFIAADLNQQGWLAVVTQESGYKGIVTIYDSSFNPQIRFRLSSRFVMDAALAPDCKSVALLTIGLDGDTFQSQVDLYALERTEEDTDPDWSCSLGSDVILSLRWNDGGIWALGETALSIVTPQGELSGVCSYNGLYLKNFSLDGDGTAALLLGKYRAGTSAQLQVVDSDGSVRSSLPIEEQVLSLSAAGRYIALLTAGRLDIYNQDLETYSTLDSTQSAQKVLQRSDGSAMLIDSTSARIYVPQ